MRNKSKRSQRATILTLVVALGAAVYLNWEYARTEPLTVETAVQDSAAEPVDAVVTDALETAAEPTADKNYGEAQLVSVNTDSSDFFEQARLTRTKTRDEALDTIQKSLKNASLSDAEKEQLTEQLSQQVENITREGEIESLIKAKGFVDCVVYLGENKADVTVQTANDGLSKTEVAQIRDAILSRCEVSAQNITVVEVK